MEVAVVSCTEESNGSVSLWNPFNSTIVSSYHGGGICGANSLVANGGYVVSAQKEKPMLHAWSLNKQHRMNKRLVCPGKITCLDISPDFQYIAVGVQSRVHVYQTASGLPCGSSSEHFQPVRVVRFSADGSLLGLAGDDGLIVVHHLCVLVDKAIIDRPPLFTSHAHSLPITDFFFTGGGLDGRIVTCSVDLCVKMHDLGTKQLLYNGVFERQLSKLALAPAEACYFVGDFGGYVHEISLLEPPRSIDTHYVNSNLSFKPHDQKITALSCSIDTLHLLSASMDGTVRLTHIPSQQTLQTIEMKSPVTNCFFYIPPLDMFSESFTPSVVFSDFINNPSSVPYTTIDISCSTDIIPEDSDRDYVLHFGEASSKTSSDIFLDDSEEVQKLYKINNEIYHFALHNIFKNAHKHQRPIEDDTEEAGKKKVTKQSSVESVDSSLINSSKSTTGKKNKLWSTLKKNKKK